MRILLVDDSPFFLSVITSLLDAERGVEIVGQARSGHEALEQVASQRPDLVLMDLTMPGMDGLEATRRLKAQPDAPLVVILTLHNNLYYRRAATEAGADGYIPKRECDTQLPALFATLSGEAAFAES